MPLAHDTTKLKNHISYEYQVREMIREKVISGEYAPGEKLPSFRKIAASLGTNVFTVHKAVSALQNEGLLISSPGRGTFAQKREEKLTCVGVYCTADAKGSPYSHAVREALRNELCENGIEIDIWTDPRSRDQFGEPWQALIKAAEQRRFQAFIAVEINPMLMSWQNKLPVPTAFLGAGPSFRNDVDNDMEQFVEMSLRELARQGCRSVGFIAPVFNAYLLDHPEHARSSEKFNILEHFTDVASELGLTVKNEWMRVFRGSLPLGVPFDERFGYEEFLKLWSQPEKPEGLLVFSDVIARGVVMAIREKQIRVPDELKLALSKIERIDLFCPMPATFVVASERDAARALIELVKKQFRGESCERILLPFKLAAHNQP